MHAAGRDMTMRAYKLKPIDIYIGKQCFSQEVYSAPIEDDMLLGLDFLYEHQAKLNMETSKMQLGNEQISMFMIEDNNKVNTLRIAKVVIPKKARVPAMSVLRVPCKIEGSLSQYLIEPELNAELISPKTLHNDDGLPVMSFVNYTNKDVILHANQLVGTAHEIDCIIPEDPETVTINMVGVDDNKGDNLLSEHIADLFNKSCENLAPPEQEKLKSLLAAYEDVFARTEFDLGNFTAITHKIDTGSTQPIKQRIRRTPWNFVEEEEKHLSKMLEAGVIEPSTSEWASPPVLIRKRDGNIRWCVDYRALNKVTKKDVFPLPLIEECIDTLSGNVWFSKLDANSAYWQVKIDDEDKCKTAVITKYGLFQFAKMPFGLCNAPSTFTRVMNLVLRGLHWKTVLAFLDDILVLGKNFEDHLQNLEDVFRRFRSYGLKLKAKKCDLFQKRVEFLGRVVSQNGVETGPGFIKTMENWPTPTNTKEVERFCGFANYHRGFIKDFARISTPLYALTGKKPFHWDDEQQEAFEQLKQALVSAPVLTIPTKEDPFILDTDASEFAVGAELIQVQNEVERCIAYCSLSLDAEQRKYCTTRKELLAVVRATRQFRHYLLGRPFTVRTDHSSLRWLLNFKNLNGQLARWMEELSQFEMTIVHRPGSKHENADFLSRIPDEAYCPHSSGAVTPTDLPCGGCKFCLKIHQNWSQFIEDVDYATTLAQKPEMKQGKGYNCGSRTIYPEETEEYGLSQLFMVQAMTRSTTNTPDLDPDGDDDDRDRDKAESRSWVSGYSWEDVSTAQSADKNLDFIIQWLKSQENPSENDLFLSSPAAKHYWINKDLYCLDSNGVLWRKGNDDSHVQYLVIPSTLTNEVMKWCHDLPASGHQGINRTLARVKDRFHWYSMTKEIRNYVVSCAACNRTKKPNQHAKCQMRLFHAGSPMERVHLDFLGPFPVTKRNNSYILMMVDQFTKWVECIPLSTQTADVTAQAAVNEFFTRFGYPFEIFTDQGPNFDSQLFKELCNRMQIYKARTTPYRPSSNGQVERFNRTLMDAVRCFVSKTHAQWDIYIPQLAGAMRSAINRSTGFTPNMLMLGREVNQPIDLLFPTPTSASDTTPDMSGYVAELVIQSQLAHETARANLKTTQATMKRNYDLRTVEKAYKKGDVVYVLDTAAVKGKCRKLSANWKGPGLILEVLSPYLYKVKLRGKDSIMNHDRLKLCKDRQLPHWIRKHQTGTKDAGDPTGTNKTSKYCICRGPDYGTFMIQCDECREWFHETCVNVTAEDAKCIDVFLCPQCDV